MVARPIQQVITNGHLCLQRLYDQLEEDVGTIKGCSAGSEGSTSIELSESCSYQPATGANKPS